MAYESFITITACVQNGNLLPFEQVETYDLTAEACQIYPKTEMTEYFRQIIKIHMHTLICNYNKSIKGIYEYFQKISI